MYDVSTAQLPEPPASDDRIFIAPNAVIVLDGASAFSADVPSASAYVDTLGPHLAAALDSVSRLDLRQALKTAIAATAQDLRLEPGNGPSCTVAIARWDDTTVDLLALGDTQITTPDGVLKDDRLDSVATSERTAYRTRLADGSGYDSRHKELLRDLQRTQRQHRNREGGYWIAEADPAAADHALTESRPLSTTPWLILATDGAYGPLDHLGIEVPPTATSAELSALLRECERWEANADPDGHRLPRSKPHDDKTIVVLRHFP